MNARFHLFVSIVARLGSMSCAGTGNSEYVSIRATIP